MTGSIVNIEVRPDAAPALAEALRAGPGPSDRPDVVALLHEADGLGLRIGPLAAASAPTSFYAEVPDADAARVVEVLRACAAVESVYVTPAASLP